MEDLQYCCLMHCNQGLLASIVCNPGSCSWEAQMASTLAVIVSRFAWSRVFHAGQTRFRAEVRASTCGLSMRHLVHL